MGNDLNKYLDIAGCLNKEIKDKFDLLIKKIANDNCILEENILNLKLSKDEYNLFMAYLSLQGIEIATNLEDFIKNSEQKNIKNLDSIELYLEDLKNIPLLSLEEEKELFHLYNSGSEDAKNKIIVSNLRLVISIAKQYEVEGLDFLDLIQEGNCGLIKAIEEFDVNKGNKFSTYAYWWIKQHINLGIANKSRLIRLPFYMETRISTYIKVQRELAVKLKRYPTTKEIAEGMNLSEEDVLFLKKIINKPLSLELKLRDNEEDELIDFVVDVNAVDPEQYIMDEEAKKIVKDSFEMFDDRTKQILIYRFMDNMTLKQIGEIFNISLERVRQICRDSVRILRSYGPVKSLFFEDREDKYFVKDEDYVFNSFNDVDVFAVLFVENSEGVRILGDSDISIMKLILGLKGEKYKHNIKLVCEDFSYTPEEVVSAIKIYKIAYKKYKENILKDGNSITKKIKKRVIK